MNQKNPTPSHSDHSNEHSIITKWFEDHPPKFGNRLLDIGAYDGIYQSNSRALVLNGWNAVLVEPAAAAMVLLMGNCRGFNNVRLVNAYVCGPLSFQAHPSNLTVLQHTALAQSTTNKNTFDAWKSRTNDYFPIMVPMLKISELLNAYPGPYDFVTIDTSGSEDLSILTGLLSTEFSCLVIDRSTNYELIKPACIEIGFEEISISETNAILGRV